MTDEISVVFPHHSTVCSSRNTAQNVQGDWRDSWGWKSHLYSQLPTHSNTHTHTKSQFLHGKTPHYSEPAHTLLCWRGYELHEIFIRQINYTGNTHPSVQTHIHTFTKVLSVLQLGTQLQWCHCLLPLCWLWLLLKAEHFDSVSRADTAHKAQALK